MPAGDTHHSIEFRRKMAGITWDRYHKKEYDVLREMVFSLLSENEKTVVVLLRNADHPLSLSEIHDKTLVSYRQLKRIIRRLEKKNIVTSFRDAIKIVSLNTVLIGEAA